jgi:hypothetical protein
MMSPLDDLSEFEVECGVPEDLFGDDQ